MLLWNEIGAPYETAAARMGLAHAYRAEGSQERAIQEFRAARSSFERIGALQGAAAAAQATGDMGRDNISPREQRLELGSALSADIADQNLFYREGGYCRYRLRDILHGFET